LLSQIARSAAAGASSVEARLDLLGPPLRAGRTARLLAGAARAAGLELIATCRPAREGGGFEGPEDERARLLAAWLAEGAGWVDIESGSGLAARIDALAGSEGRDRPLARCGAILSLHDPGMPADLEARAARLADEARETGAGRIVRKLVPTAGALSDLVAMRELLRGAGLAGRGADPPLVAFARGEAGAASR